jgi:redox-sensitive bicupin YhaK (pirin superfamily)
VAGIDIRKAGTRARTRLTWLDSWHSFSFGNHYDPDNTHHGLLLVSNDDRVTPGHGFGTHFHHDMEIVTWILAGQLVHEDSEGNHGELHPGLAQRMSAGTGIEHSEANPSATEELHFVQMWVPPDQDGINPSYEQLDVSDTLTAGGLHPVASGQGHDGAISIHQRDAVLWAGWLSPTEAATVPAGGHVHVFLARGDATLASGATLDTGDAARLTDAGEVGLTAGTTGAEVLIWVTA